jgi:hypothetical protein
MAIAALFDFGTPTLSKQEVRESYDRVNRELGGGREPSRASEISDGLLAHFVGESEDGHWIIVNVLESPQAMDRMMQRVAPLMQREVQAAEAPEPRVEILTLHNVLT